MSEALCLKNSNSSKISGALLRFIKNYAIYLIPFICFAAYVYIAAHLPGGQIVGETLNYCPDEPMRYDVPYFIFQHGYLPKGDIPELRNPTWGFSYAFTAYGSSLIALPFMWVASWFSTNAWTLLLAARISVATTSFLTILVLVRIGKYLMPQSKLAQATPAILVGFLPQFAFVSAYVNCDALCVFVSALVILCWAKGIKNKWRYKDAVLLGLSLGVCALSYYFAYGMILASIVVYYVSCAQQKDVKKKEFYLYRPLVIVGCALLVSGWFFIRNAIIYQGDFLGMNALTKASQEYAADPYKPSNRHTALNLGISPADMLLGCPEFPNSWIITTARSFFGVFGYMSAYLSSSYYLLYYLIVIIGLLLVAYIIGKRRAFFPTSLMLGLIMAAIIPLLLSVYYSWATDYEPQGRYLFSALPALMIFVSWGWSQTFPCAFAKDVKHKAEHFTSAEKEAGSDIADASSPAPSLASTTDKVALKVQWALLLLVDIGWVYLFCRVLKYFLFPQ